MLTLTTPQTSTSTITKYNIVGVNIDLENATSGFSFIYTTTDSLGNVSIAEVLSAPLSSSLTAIGSATGSFKARLYTYFQSLTGLAGTVT